MGACKWFNFGEYNLTWIGWQMAYNANKLTKIARERDKAQNWLDYFQLKYKRKPAMRPMTKVLHSTYFLYSSHNAVLKVFM